MNFKNKVNWYYLFLNLAILLLSLIGVYNFSKKSNFPLLIKQTKNYLVVDKLSELSTPLISGDTLLTFDGLILKSREELEVYLDGKSIGDEISVEYKSKDITKSAAIKLTNFYSSQYVIIATIVGIVFLLTGIIVLVKCEKKYLGIIFHWCMLSTAMIILMTWGNFSDSGKFLGFLTRAGFHFGYAFIPTFFLHFSFLFPSEQNINYRKGLKILYGMSFVFTLIQSIFFAKYVNNPSLEYIKFYLKTFDLTSIYVVVLISFSIGIQIKKYFSTAQLSERKKIRWILLGYLVGPGMYLIFWVIPQRLIGHGLIAEDIIVLLNIFVPITFAIAIIKYHVFDIDVIVRRSIVYPITILLLIIIYITVSSFIVNLIELPNNYIVSIATAIVIAMFFHPIKETIKKQVNKKIFKVEYDFRIALNNFLDEIKEIGNLNSLTTKLLSFIDRIFQVDKIAFLIYDQIENKFYVSQQINIKEIINSKIEFEQKIYKDNIFLIADKSSVEDNTNANEKLPIIFKEKGIKLNYIIKIKENQLYGVLILGEKKSRALYSIEDIDLLKVIISKFSETIEKIGLQEELLREKIEREKFEELNRLKSFFVSCVSHDLKTPLTSIKMFAEILKSTKNIPQEKTSKYLEIIEGESDRLTRLIDNVLNYSKIEKGIKEYIFTPINLTLLLEEILNIMKYQFEMNKFSVIKNLEDKDLIVNADKDSVIEAIINLLSNSIKFSPQKKEIEIRLYSENSFAAVEVIDKGIGISESEINNLFIPFFQSSQVNIEQRTGAGLGLTIVKNIMDAHEGKIIVKSTEGKGSSFKLLFPKMES